ncbi:MAG: methionyl-tRNA formyltransferase [bacterium]|nr:methionyl-tRNA formyltransferase [bacterium]
MAKVVFMGTPDFAVPTLQALLRHHEVIGVVTQPDRPAGRGGQVQQSPIKQLALQHGVPVFQPEKIRRAEAVSELKQWQPDVYVVAAFGQILPQSVLDIPPFGSINVHASLLPRWRGAAPIHAAILAGDDLTGVTIMKMDAGLDTGPMLSQGKIEIQPDETGQSLHDKLAQLGADLLVATLPGYLSGAIQPQVQPENGVTYAPQINKEEGRIDWTLSAWSIERKVRAFTPWPGTFTEWNGQMLKIHAGVADEDKQTAEVFTLFREDRDERTSSTPVGTVIDREGYAAIVTGEGIFYPQTVQLAGKKAVSIDDFLHGYPDFIGAQLV